MKKIFFTLLLELSLVCNAFAVQRIFPEQGLMTFQGLDDTSSPPIVRDGRAADIQNINLDITGAASKRNGYSMEVMLDTNAINDSFEAVTSLYEFYKSDGTRTKIATCGDKIFSWSTGTKTNITGSNAITEGKDYQWSWITALDYAIGTNGLDPPIQTQATILTTSAVSFTGLSSPITKAKCIAWWKNYLIFGNTVENSVNRTTRIRWSNVGTINTWSNNDYVDIATLGGQSIEAFATLYDDLYVFLTDSIYKVSLVGGNELVNVSKVSEGIGCIAKNSIKTIGIGNSEGIVFLSRDKTINYLDGIKIQELSTLISDAMDGLSASRLPYAVAIDDRRNAHYYIAVTDGSASTNNMLLDYHYGIGEWSKHIQIDANAFCIANDANTIPQVYFGNYHSFIYQMNDPDLNSDVAGETGTISLIYGKDIIDTTTASGLTVFYNPSANFTNVTGATVRFTSGTGSGKESVIVYAGGPLCTTGIVVADASLTATGNTVYSIGDIDAFYTTKWYDTGFATRRKNFGELFLWTTSDTSVTMQVYYGTDFSSTIKATEAEIGQDGSLWGTAIWDANTWSGTETALTRIPLNVTGRFIKYKFSNSGIDEPMDLDGYSFLLWDLDEF